METYPYMEHAIMHIPLRIKDIERRMEIVNNMFVTTRKEIQTREEKLERAFNATNPFVGWCFQIFAPTPMLLSLLLGPCLLLSKRLKKTLPFLLFKHPHHLKPKLEIFMNGTSLTSLLEERLLGFYIHKFARVDEPSEQWL